ncbi:hypothetical protein [Pseudochryseolinea flava]|uniref:Uncharacterized protein n=1 Tax=Pseudochryseolinea flava TaxID=2059302 RepID=A0A364Y7M3_9BACT|nr:hypothetical protein [Pseudochryseolinea flava]RAW01824.1 hypothetical protein DQQ10_09275 [Pseudochryseolinea flava]
MKSMTFLLQVATVTILTTLVCTLSVHAQEDEDSLSTAMFDQLIELKEFKEEFARIEALQAQGKDTQITFSVPVQPANPEHKALGIVTVYINERKDGVEEYPLYEVRFDKKTEKILEIEKKY